MPLTEYITTAEAMRRLGYKDRSSITRYVADGRLTPAMKLDGRTGAYLFDPAEIERFKAERSAAA